MPARRRTTSKPISDQQAAEGAYKAARAAVRVFGKTEAEIDKIVEDRKIDPALVVPSPIGGLITARNAAPGLLVQPGNPPPVYVVADMSTMWMLANVPEKDAPALKVGQEVSVTVAPLPGRVFKGKIVTIGATVDPNTRRVLVRSEIANPNNELRAGMFANFTITVAPPKTALAVPQEAVVREGDGTMTVWVTGEPAQVRQAPRQDRPHARWLHRNRRWAEARRDCRDGGSLFIANQYSNRPVALNRRGRIMFKGLVAFGLTRRPIALLLLAAFIVAGAAAFTKLNIEAYPNPAPVIIEITAQSAGLSAEEMERLYTVPIEVGVAATPGVNNIRSTSFYGLSFVRVTFEYGVDYYQALQQIGLNLQQNVSLPNNVQPQIQASSVVGEIYRYQIKGPAHFGLTNLRTIQDWILQRRLLTVPGVVQVNTWGGTTKEYEVEADLDKLEAYGITLQQLVAAIANANVNIGARSINIGKQSVNIRGIWLDRQRRCGGSDAGPQSRRYRDHNAFPDERRAGTDQGCRAGLRWHRSASWQSRPG